MASGRGFSLKSFKLKDKEDESDTQSVTSTSSTAFLLQGRGRSLAAFGVKPKPTTVPEPVAEPVDANLFKNDSDEEENALSRGTAAKVVATASGSLPDDQNSAVGGGSVLTSFSMGRGRGFFSNPMKPSSNKSVPSPVASQTRSKEPLSSSGIEQGPSTPRETASSPLVTQLSGTGSVPQGTSQTLDSASTGTQRTAVIRHGKKGQPITACTNAIPIHCNPDSGVFEYEVRFHPMVDSPKFRGRYLMQHKELIGNAKTFDGVILFLPHKLPDDVTRLVSESQDDKSDINVTITFKRRKRLGDCLQLYNILFDKIYKVLNYLRVNRKFYDPSAPQLLPNKRLEVWPGYVKAVDELEGGLMLTLDVSHRVLATRTVLENMTESYKNNREHFQDNIKKELIGKVVITRYNNKTYRIDDIDFEQSPKNTFKQGDKDISYADYYKQQYNIEIKDMNQRLLISRKELRISGEPEKKEFIFCLIPELCYMTGLSDAMKKNFTVLKELGTYTKLSPYMRLGAYKKFLQNVENTPKAKEILTDWGLSLDKDPVKVTARVFDEEKIIFGNGKTGGAGDRADFSKHATTNEVLEVVDFHEWLLVYTVKDRATATSFVQTMMKVCGPTGISVSEPRRLELKNDRTETFVNETREALKTGNTQIVVIIFPSARDDRYAAIKRTLCVEVPIPSQVINLRTLQNEAKSRSVVQKIILQMNCKLGGTLWGVKIPLKETMICGIDTYHEAGLKGKTVAGFVATYNPEFTKWFSRPTIQEKREELVNGLVASMESAIAKYYDYNKYYPQSIVIYRDGVSDGQMEFVKNYEILQFKEAFKRVKDDYCPKLTFIVVKKRIDMKYFRCLEGKTGDKAYVNAPPGTVVDSVVTTKFMYDFYIISQYIREGTSTPSHYVVLEDEKEFDPDILQRMTYKLCYLYYNWPGTVRVPAPCQYAHKLADLIGMSVKAKVSEKLADKLYFL